MTEETNHNAYKLGLALSGGGAKGFAHIGVFRLLEECGLKPDIIVDLVNFNIEETEKIFKGFCESQLSHYLYCSSC